MPSRSSKPTPAASTSSPVARLVEEHGGLLEPSASRMPSQTALSISARELLVVSSDETRSRCSTAARWRAASAASWPCSITLAAIAATAETTSSALVARAAAVDRVVEREEGERPAVGRGQRHQQRVVGMPGVRAGRRRRCPCTHVMPLPCEVELVVRDEEGVVARGSARRAACASCVRVDVLAEQRLARGGVVARRRRRPRSRPRPGGRRSRPRRGSRAPARPCSRSPRTGAAGRRASARPRPRRAGRAGWRACRPRRQGSCSWGGHLRRSTSAGTADSSRLPAPMDELKGLILSGGTRHAAAPDHLHVGQAAGAGGEQAGAVLRHRGDGRRRASARSGSSSRRRPATRSARRRATARSSASRSPTSSRTSPPASPTRS